MATVTRRIGGIAVALALTAGVAVRAQVTTADIVGRVTDNTGAVLPGATVTVQHVATGVVRTTVTGDTGDYVFTLLPIGAYTVQIELQGFQTHAARTVLASGDRSRVDARLQLSGVAESVTVTAEAPLVQTDSSAVSALVTREAVQDLPVVGRNFVRFLSLVPGANEGTGNAFTGGERPDERRQTNAFSVNGALDNQNNVMVDGFDNNERQIGSIGIKPSIDAIAEIRVQTNLYTAEVGRTSGGVVNIITNSGTNTLSGSAFEFARSDRFDARNFFARTKPLLKQHQFGGSLGGPIQRNRMFFFADYEGFTQDQGIPYVLTVPTERMRRGDFSELSAVIYDPTTPVRTPFPGNRIPADRIDPIGQRLVNLYPLPTSPGLVNNYQTTSVKTQDSHTADLRVDHSTSAGSLFVRYSMNNVDTYIPTSCEIPGAEIQPGCSAGGGQFSGPNQTDAHAVHTSYASVLGPTLVSELRVGYTRLDIQSFPTNFGTNAAERLGLQNLNVDRLSSHLPNFTMIGYSDLGDFRFVPLLNLSDTWQFAGSLTKTAGSHTIKMGGGAILRDYALIQSPFATGGFRFDNRLTNSGRGGSGGNTIASTLLGFPSEVRLDRTTFDDPLYSTNEPHVYVNDDWRATSNLTLNIGLRYEVFTPISEREGRMSNFDPATGRILVGGRDGVSKSAGVKTDWGNISPRAGFAAMLPGDVVLRGGYGLSYFPAVYKSQGLLKNPPFISAYGLPPPRDAGGASRP